MENTFKYNLSIILAHSVIFEARISMEQNGIQSHTLVCGPSSNPTVGDTTDQSLQAYIKDLPSLLNVTAAQTLPVGQQTQNAQNVLAPQQQALQTQMATQDLPGLEQLGVQLNNQQNQGGIANANQAVTGAGGNLAKNEEALQQQLDPQYYNTRAAASSQLSNLLTSLGTGGAGLGANDMRNISSSLATQDAQKGLLNAPSQTQAVSNAVQFGNQATQQQAAKTNTLSQAIGAATSFLPSSQGPVSAVNNGTGSATNAPTTSGTNNFLGTTGTTGVAGATGTNTALGNSLLGSTSSIANAAADRTANQASTLDMATQAAGAVPSE